MYAGRHVDFMYDDNYSSIINQENAQYFIFQKYDRNTITNNKDFFLFFIIEISSN